MKKLLLLTLLLAAQRSWAMEKTDMVLIIKSQSKLVRLKNDTRPKNGFGHRAPITQQFNWTDGCIAVTDQEMDQIWQAVDVETPTGIRP